MLTRRIIPCLDVRDGRIVKGVRFAELRDAGDPVARAAAYADDGADEIVMLDVSATTDDRATAIATVRDLRAALSIPLTVGGGIRRVEDALGLLEAGADKIGMNTAAVERPALVAEVSSRAGAQCVVVAIDAARRSGRAASWEVVTRAGRHRTGLDVAAWAKEVERLGAGEILLTSWDRDGTGEGYDLELLRAVAGAVRIPIIASGGAAGASHMIGALESGADAVLCASILHDGVTTVGSLKAALGAAGVEVRR